MTAIRSAAIVATILLVVIANLATVGSAQVAWIVSMLPTLPSIFGSGDGGSQSPNYDGTPVIPRPFRPDPRDFTFFDRADAQSFPSVWIGSGVETILAWPQRIDCEFLIPHENLLSRRAAPTINVIEDTDELYRDVVINVKETVAPSLMFGARRGSDAALISPHPIDDPRLRPLR